MPINAKHIIALSPLTIIMININTNRRYIRKKQTNSNATRTVYM